MADLYRISVSIAMQNGVSGVLGIIQRDLFGLNKAVDLTAAKFGRLQQAAIGGMAAIAGGAALSGIADLASAGGRLIDAQQQMLQLGISYRDVMKETAVAFQAVSIAGTTPSQNLADLVTLRAVLGGLPEANMALKGFEEAKYSLSVRGISTSDLDSLVKALDLMGAFTTNGKIDPAKFEPAINRAVSAILTTGGLLTGKGLYQAVRLAGPAAQAMGEDTFLNTMVEVLLATGNRGARGLEYAATTFLGGQMSKNSAMMLDRLGLTKAADYTHEGGRWSLKYGSIAGAADLENKGHIIDWIQKYFLPATAKAGLTPLQAAAALPQTLQLLISTVANLTPQMAKSVVQQAQAGSVNPYQAAYDSWSGTIQDLETAIGGKDGKGGLWDALGGPLAQQAIPVIHDLTAEVRGFTQWAGSHPGDIKVIADGLVGLSAGITGLGVALTATVIVGLIGTGGVLAGLAFGFTAAGAALTALNWRSVTADIGGAFTLLKNDLEDLVNFLLHGILPPDKLPPGYVHGHDVPWMPKVSDPPVGAPKIKGSSLTGGDAPPQSSNLANAGAGADGTSQSAASGRQSYDNGLRAIKDWIDAGAPVTGSVAVTNTKDIANATTAQVKKQITAPQTGPTQGSYRATPSGSAATAMGAP